MNHEEYIKQLEEANSSLQSRLDSAQKYVDAINDNPFRVSLNLMIKACIAHQEKATKGRRVFRFDENRVLRIQTPRQIGLSTTLIHTCSLHFDNVHILEATIMGSNRTEKNIFTHKSVNDIPNDVDCIIVDPWRVKFRNVSHSDWDSIQDKLVGKLNKQRPSLLILAG